MTRENQALASQLEERKREVEPLLATLEAARGEIRQARARVEALEKERVQLAPLVQEREALALEIQRLREEKGAATAAASSLQRERDRLGVELDQARLALRRSRADLESLREQGAERLARASAPSQTLSSLPEDSAYLRPSRPPAPAPSPPARVSPASRPVSPPPPSSFDNSTGRVYTARREDVASEEESLGDRLRRLLGRK